MVPFPSRQLCLTVWELCRVSSPHDSISHGFGVAVGHGDVSAPMSPRWAPHSSGCWALQQGLGPCVQILELFTRSLWIRAHIWSEWCSCGVCPKLKEMFILQNVLFLPVAHSCASLLSFQRHHQCVYHYQKEVMHKNFRSSLGICHRCNAE